MSDEQENMLALIHEKLEEIHEIVFRLTNTHPDFLVELEVPAWHRIASELPPSRSTIMYNGMTQSVQIDGYASVRRKGHFSARVMEDALASAKIALRQVEHLARQASRDL